jgi:hypothetical protein
MVGKMKNHSLKYFKPPPILDLTTLSSPPKCFYFSEFLEIQIDEDVLIKNNKIELVLPNSKKGIKPVVLPIAESLQRHPQNKIPQPIHSNDSHIKKEIETVITIETSNFERKITNIDTSNSKFPLRPLKKSFLKRESPSRSEFTQDINQVLQNLTFILPFNTSLKQSKAVVVKKEKACPRHAASCIEFEAKADQVYFNLLPSTNLTRVCQKKKTKIQQPEKETKGEKVINLPPLVTCPLGLVLSGQSVLMS